MSENHDVFFAIPAASSVVEVDLVNGLFRELAEFVNRRWGIAIEFSVGNNGIHLARNFLVKRFLETNCTDPFFIDSDIAWEPGDVVKMIEHPVDFVLGLYRLKHPRESYTYYANEDLVRESNGLMKIQGGPAGFMRLRRRVIERMIDNLPPPKDGGWMVEPLRQDYPLPVLFSFNPRRDPATGMVHQTGEDLDFCLKWGEMGEQVWLDPDLTLHHIGKIKYSSNFWHSYQTKPKVMHGHNGQTTVREAGGTEAERRKFDEIVSGATRGAGNTRPAL